MYPDEVDAWWKMADIEFQDFIVQLPHCSYVMGYQYLSINIHQL